MNERMKLMQEMSKQKDEWEELIRSGFAQYNVCVPLHSIRYSNAYLGGPKYRKLLLYFKKDIAFYYENFADHRRVGEYCINLFLEDKKLFANYMKYWHKSFKNLDMLFRKHRKLNLRKLDNKELAGLLENLYKKSIRWHGIAYNVDAIDVTLSTLIEKLIQKAYTKEKKSIQGKIYSKLTFPNVLSYANRTELEKLKLFQKIRERGIKRSEEDIRRFLENYYWVQFGWKKSEEYDRKKLLEDYKKYGSDQIKKEIRDINKAYKKNIKDKKRLLSEFSRKKPIIRKYIKIFDEYAVLHDLRKEGQVRSIHAISKIYEELSRRLRIASNLLFHLWPLELVEIAQGKRKPDITLMKRRSREWFCIHYSNGKTEEFFGKEAIKMRNKEFGIDTNKKQKEFSGLAASQGRAIGPAKICLSVGTAAKKIKQGDILVTGMTMPEFVPYMKKAGAVVTDEGGLTCHAAIISRELGIPCIVGTKIATRIIKDNDVLEVNANHGVVKVLKK